MARAELKTARLILRPPMAADAGWIAREIARPEVHAMLTAPPRPYSLADATNWLAAAGQHSGQYVIMGDGPLGVVTAESLTRGPELGYWLQVSAWGRGYMTEAARAVVAEYFAATEEPLASGHLAGNEGSAGVLKKLGFGYSGVVRRKSGYFGHEVDVQRMSLDRAGFVACLPVEARSERLTYRVLQATDAGALHRIVSAWEVVRQLYSWPWPADRAFTVTRAAPFRGDGFAWGIFRQGVLIGTVAVTDGELGYFLQEDASGQGYATEAARVAIDRAFASGRDHLTAGIWADNAASLHVLHKLGFRVTGDDRAWSQARQADLPGRQLRLDRADWPGA